MLHPSVITRDKVDNAIDTCRIFEDSFDFWDGDGDGWHIVKADVICDFGIWSRKDAEAVLPFCSWLVKSSIRDIEENFMEENVWGIICKASDEFADIVDLLLGLSPAGALHDNSDLPQRISSRLCHHITRQNWKIVSLFLAWGADPHHAAAIDGSAKGTPLSVSMYSSWTFWGLRNVLHGRGLDVKDFAYKELEEGRPLLDDGWQMETLTALLELDFEPYIAPDLLWSMFRCHSCKRVVYHGYRTVIVQPYWGVIVEGIKNGISPQKSCSDTQDDQPSNSQHNLTVLDNSSTDTTNDSALSQDPALSEDEAAHPDQELPANGVDNPSIIFDRKEVWCVKCWNHFKKTGLRRTFANPVTNSSDEDDFSPYLIHT